MVNQTAGQITGAKSNIYSRNPSLLKCILKLSILDPHFDATDGRLIHHLREKLPTDI